MFDNVDSRAGLTYRSMLALAAALSMLVSFGVTASSAAAAVSKPNAPALNPKAEIVDSAETGDRFGSTVVTGDFNGDSYEDLAVSVPFEDVDGIADAGAVNVIYGSFGGLNDTGPTNQVWHQNSFGVEDESEADDRFATRLEAGNFNGDSYDDLAIGVPYEDVDGVEDAGAVNVIHGSFNGLSAIARPDQFWHQNSSGVDDAPEEGDLFGWQVESGDFNAGVGADLAISVYSEDVVTSTAGGPVNVEDAGAVHVIHGSFDGGLDPSSKGAPDQFWHQDSSGVEDEAETSDRFGVRLAVGRFNADSYHDLAISVPYEDVIRIAPGGPVEIRDAGAVNVIHGSFNGLSATSSGAPDQFWHQDSDGVEDEAETDDQFGIRVAAGRFNAAGYEDLAIGVPFEDIGSIADAGAVNVIHGSFNGLSPTSLGAPDQFWHQDSDGVEDAAESGDEFGWQLAVGSFNAGDHEDLAIGVFGEDVAAVVDAGAVNVIHGSFTDGLSATSSGAPDQFWHQDSSGVEDQAEADDLFGWGLAAGRFNADAYDDLAIGVPAEVLGAIADAGVVNVIHGSFTDGLSATSSGAPDQLWHQDR